MPSKYPWFRLYCEFAFDPKIQALHETLQRRFIMLLCLKCNGDLVAITDEELCFALRIPEKDLEDTKSIFIKKGFVDENWDIIHWDKRQYKSDNSTERSRLYRERKKKKSDNNGNATLPQRPATVAATPPDTDTDTDTDTEKKKLFVENSHEFRLSKYLFSHIIKNNPGASKPNFQVWAKQIDYMIRIDKRKVEDIKSVIHWSQKESFWLGVILSTKNLRVKFDQVWVKMQNPIKTNSKNNNVVDGKSDLQRRNLENAKIAFADILEES